MANDTTAIPPNCAEIQQCIEAYGYVNYLPIISVNAFFLAVFSVGFIAQFLLGFRHRTWGYTAAMMVGALIEAIGYGGRIGMHFDVFIDTWFIIYLCCLTIAPAFFSCAVYLSLSRILSLYNPHLSLLKPRVITTIFISCDLLSLVLQAVGGALASVATTNHSQDIGVDVMVAGLSTQVAATTAFGVLCLHLMWAVRKHRARVYKHTEVLRRNGRVRLFLWAIALATLTILIRCAFRVAELSEGFKGSLANNEVLFLVFDAAMMTVCIGALTVAHPAWTLGDEMWVAGGFRKGGAGSAGSGVGEEGMVMGRKERSENASASASGHVTPENREGGGSM